MSYISGAGAAAAAGETASDFRSGGGGKIVRQRRLASSRTPYDRPEPPSNWLSTAGRVLVTGAGKLISSVIGSDTSSSGSDWGSDDEVASQDGHLDTVSQPVNFSSESKQHIEELIKQETFSREECDALIKIISSRTADAPTLAFIQDTHMNDHRDVAVMEARKWIEERKNETASKSPLEYGSGSLSSPLIPKEAGSPIDVARTYMQARPPWASPTANLAEFRSPTPVKIQTLTDGLSFPGFGAVLSSQTKKRDSLASGSWSIAEEMRKVRARATDQLLSTPSRKFESSDFSLNLEAISDTVKNGLRENLEGSSSFALALAAVPDKAADPNAEAPISNRATAFETTGNGPQQGPLSFIPEADLGQVPAPLSCERTGAIHENTYGLEGDMSTSPNDFQGVPSMAEGVTTEPNPGTAGNEEIPEHTSQATSEFPSKQESKLDAFTSSSKQTSNDEPIVDGSNSSPEVLLAVEATKKQHRVKQPVRVGRGRGRGRGRGK